MDEILQKLLDDLKEYIKLCTSASEEEIMAMGQNLTTIYKGMGVSNAGNFFSKGVVFGKLYKSYKDDISGFKNPLIKKIIEGMFKVSEYVMLTEQTYEKLLPEITASVEVVKSLAAGSISIEEARRNVQFEKNGEPMFTGPLGIEILNEALKFLGKGEVSLWYQ